MSTRLRVSSRHFTVRSFGLLLGEKTSMPDFDLPSAAGQGVHDAASADPTAPPSDSSSSEWEQQLRGDHHEGAEAIPLQTLVLDAAPAPVGHEAMAESVDQPAAIYPQADQSRSGAFERLLSRGHSFPESALDLGAQAGGLVSTSVHIDKTIPSITLPQIKQVFDDVRMFYKGDLTGKPADNPKSDDKVYDLASGTKPYERKIVRNQMRDVAAEKIHAARQQIPDDVNSILRACLTG